MRKSEILQETKTEATPPMPMALTMLEMVAVGRETSRATWTIVSMVAAAPDLDGEWVVADFCVDLTEGLFLLLAAKVRSSCEEGPGQSALQSAYHNPKLDVTELKQNRTSKVQAKNCKQTNCGSHGR